MPSPGSIWVRQVRVTDRLVMGAFKPAFIWRLHYASLLSRPQVLSVCSKGLCSQSTQVRAGYLHYQKWPQCRAGF